MMMTRTVAGLWIVVALVGCASMSSGIAGVDVVLTSQPMTPGHHILDAGSPMPRVLPMDRFRAADPVYVRIGFTDSMAHRMSALVSGPSSFSRSWTSAARPDRRSVTWQFTLSPANTLSPGDYVLKLTIDEQPAGTYAFTVE
ncbi:MAG: hypothetical protein ACRELS_11115 [Candidatus Rokuibacteriota bacterium]